MIKKIYQKISLYSFFLVSVFIFLFSIRYIYIRQNAVPKELQKLYGIYTDRSSKIILFIDKVQKDFEDLVKSEDIINIFLQSKKKEPISQELIAIINHAKKTIGLNGIIICDLEENIIFSSKKIISNVQSLLRVSTEKNKYPIKNAFTDTLHTLSTTISEIGYDPIFDTNALAIAVPLFLNDTIAGICIGLIDQKKIHNIIQNYSDFGSSGEIVFGKSTNVGALIIAPTRLNPDISIKKRFILKKEVDTPIQYAVKGYQGKGVGFDYRNTKVIAVWQYLARLNWGQVTKIDYEEIIQSTKKIKNLILFLFVLLIFCTLSLFFLYPKKRVYFYNYILSKKMLRWTKRHTEIVIYLFSVMSFVMLSFCIYNLYNNSRQKIYSAKENAIQKLIDITEQIQSNLSSSESLVHSMVTELESGELKKQDIPIRIKRDLQENNHIVGLTVAFEPYKYDSTKKLYAAQVIQKNPETIIAPDITKIYDYTLSTQPGKPDSQWYTKGLEKNNAWIDVMLEPISKKTVAIYSSQFTLNSFSKKPDGIISLMYDMDEIRQNISTISIGNTGYPFIVNKKTQFLYHPTSQIVKKEETFFNFAQKQGSEKLYHIAKEIENGSTVQDFFVEKNSGRTFWIQTKSITHPDWIFGVIFPEDEVDLATNEYKKYYIVILCWLIIFLLSILAIICDIIHGQIKSFRYFSAGAIVILLISLFCLSQIIQYSQNFNKKNEAIITDQTGLDKFLEEIIQETESKHEEIPILIPTGTYLYSLNFPDTKHVSFSGYIWQTYLDEQQKTIGTGIRLPQANIFEINQAFEHTQDNTSIIGFEIDAQTAYEQKLTYFPFDIQHIRIPLVHKNIIKNILLTPDLEDYKKIMPSELPGMNNELEISEFDIKKTYFSFEPINTNTTFGIPFYEQISHYSQLTYNIILKRNLLNPLILYLLPLLIILLTMFAVFFITGHLGSEIIDIKDPYNSLGAYTGFFLALVFLHRTLRRNFPTGDTLFIEYFFFYTYITILILVTHLVAAEKLKDSVFFFKVLSPILVYLFWPIQLLIWVLTTMYIFY